MNRTEIYAQISPVDIDFLSKIIEGYDHIGVLSTLSPEEGRVIIRVTEDTWPDMMEILGSLPFPIQLLETE